MFTFVYAVLMMNEAILKLAKNVLVRGCLWGVSVIRLKLLIYWFRDLNLKPLYSIGEDAFRAEGIVHK